jgi:mRNA interferase HigB
MIHATTRLNPCSAPGGLTHGTVVTILGTMVTETGTSTTWTVAVRVISRKPLREFSQKHADARVPLDSWYRIMRGREYRSPHEIRADFPSASFLGARRTVFNIGGNRYRLVVDVRYDLGRVYVRDILTHAEYDRRTMDDAR